MKAAWSIVIAAVAGGCVIDNDRYTRPGDLSPRWRVDDTRILGIRSLPAEANPGDQVTFEALIADPQNRNPGALWVLCELSDPQDEDGCIGDISSLDPEESPSDDVGIIGFEPLLPPQFTVPEDALDGLDERERREGLEVLVQITTVPEELLEDPELAIDDLDVTTLQVGFKRLIVSDAAAPNENPILGSFTVDGEQVPAGIQVVVAPDAEYEIGVEIPESSIERYQFVNRDGEIEDRIEEPYAAWFATEGEIDESFTLWPFIDSTWIAPSRRGSTGAWFAVVRDRRGGMGWIERRWVVQ